VLFGDNPPPLDPKTIPLKNHEPTKSSSKKAGAVKAYAANTNQGIVRDYNEDRVSIILNIVRPRTKQNYDGPWPNCSFFGVFDGHGGATCADFLRDNLHNFIVRDAAFPEDPRLALANGIRECELSFLEQVEKVHR